MDKDIGEGQRGGVPMSLVMGNKGAVVGKNADGSISEVEGAIGR
jgi:hypothetical protein